MKKSAVFALTMVMLMSAVACGTEDKEADNIQSDLSQTAENTEASTDVYGRPLIESAIPSDLSFNGEGVTIFLRQQTSIFDTVGEFVAESENGEVVNDAVYKRNLEAQEQLNIKLNYSIQPGGVDFGQYATALRKSNMSGDQAYDILAMYAYFAVAITSEKLTYNLCELPYFEPEKPWWNKSFTEEMTLFDQLYFAAGDLSLTSTQCIHAIFFNKQLVKDYFGNLNLYNVVEEGKWTIDYFYDLVKGVYADLNGNSQVDEADMYAVGLSGVSTPVDAYLDAFDLKITEKDSEGIPRLVYKNERTISAFEKIYNLTFNNTGVGYYPATVETYLLMQDKFNNSETMFLFDMFHATNRLRNMKDDYGVLPMIKYDEAQSGYYTNVSDIYSLLAVTSDTKNPEVTGAVFELLSQKSYEHVTPAYFEIALKRKYASTDIDAQMYDLIRAGTRYNFGLVYSNCISNPIWIWRGLIISKSNDFVSTFTSSEKIIEKQLEQIVEFYMENK